MVLKRLIALEALVIAGYLVSFYALYVESQLDNFPGYQPACDVAGWGSCSKVFKSSYSKPLSHFGLVPNLLPKDFDFSLPQLALVYFGLIFAYPVFRKQAHWRLLYFIVGVAAVCFNLWLAAILKFVMKEFCIVCFSNYVVNGGIFSCIALDFFKPARVGTKAKAKEA
eukprot:gene1052-732_t